MRRDPRLGIRSRVACRLTRFTGSFSIRRVNLNFPSQLGVAWDPKGNANAVLRAGIGLYRQNVLYSNIFDLPYRPKSGHVARDPHRACPRDSSLLIATLN